MSSAAKPEQGAEPPVPPEGAGAAADAAAEGTPPAAAPLNHGIDGDSGDELWHSDEDDVDEDDAEFGDWLDHDMEDEEWEVMGEMDDDEDEEDEDNEEMGVLLPDSGSSSDDEDEDSVEAQVAAETSGRHVFGDWAAYAIPTVSHHFQSADALSVVQLPASAGGGILAATFDADGLSAWLLPGAGSLQTLGGDSQPAAHRLGGFQAPKDIYSMSLSPCGRWIATGGEGGLLCLYSLDPSAPPRRPISKRKPQLRGLNFLFTPHCPPSDLMAQLAEQMPRVMQTFGSTVGVRATLRALNAAWEGAAGIGSLQAATQHRVAQHMMSAIFSQSLHGNFNDLQVEATHSAMQKHLQRAQQAGAALATQAADLQALCDAGQAGAHDQLAAVQQQQADNAISQRNAQLHLQALEHHMEEQEMRNTAALAVASVEEARQPTAVAGAGSQPGSRHGKQPAVPPDHAQQQQQQQQGEAVPPAALVLRGIFSLGLHEHNAPHVPFLSNGMTNGVRWGPLAGQLRLLAADQSQYVYIFNRPSPGPAEDGPSSSSGSGGGDGELQPEHMLCSGLGEPSPFWRLRAVNFFRTQQHALGARISQQFPPSSAPEQAPADAPAAPAPARSQRAAAAAASAAWAPLAQAAAGRCIERGSHYMTAALGPFPVPCNLAAASPDGRWVAVVGDSPAVFLCDQAAGFAWRQLAYGLAGPQDTVEAGIEQGAQYLAWNSTSTLLAVTSDALHAVFVFEPLSGALVLRVEGHRRPCLGVAFAPWDDRLLIYAEESNHVHLRPVPRESEAAAGDSSGGDGGEAEGQQGAAPPAAALFEQNAQDDLADPRPGYQLVRLPLLQPGPAPHPSVGMGTRRRRINGLALTPHGDLLLAKKQGKVLRYISSQPWAVERHMTWPRAFTAAARTVLCCAHRQPPVGAGVGLWSLPLPLLQRIVELLAGSRLEWLRSDAPPDGSAGHGGQPAGGIGAQVPPPPDHRDGSA